MSMWASWTFRLNGSLLKGGMFQTPKSGNIMHLHKTRLQ